jgi:hypothetical protein
MNTIDFGTFKLIREAVKEAQSAPKNEAIMELIRRFKDNEAERCEGLVERKVPFIANMSYSGIEISKLDNYFAAAAANMYVKVVLSDKGMNHLVVSRINPFTLPKDHEDYGSINKFYYYDVSKATARDAHKSILSKEDLSKFAVFIPLASIADNTTLEGLYLNIRRYKRLLATAQEESRQRNLLLHGLLHVECTGNCGPGHLPPLTAAVVESAINSVHRLVTKYSSWLFGQNSMLTLMMEAMSCALNAFNTLYIRNRLNDLMSKPYDEKAWSVFCKSISRGWHYMDEKDAPSLTSNARYVLNRLKFTSVQRDGYVQLDVTMPSAAYIINSPLANYVIANIQIANTDDGLLIQSNHESSIPTIMNLWESFFEEAKLKGSINDV